MKDTKYKILNTKYSLRIAWMYPNLMSTYGDRGNILCLQKRCEWRDIGVDIVSVSKDISTKVLENCDLIFMGGAQDRQQQLVNDDLLQVKGPVMRKMIEADIPALFVCAAYQFAGHYYKAADGKKIPGLGLLDLYTEHPGDQKKRLIGNVTAELDARCKIHGVRLKNTIVGFENHGGRTTLGNSVQPLATVIRGNGNNDIDKTEGVLYKSTIGSYFHGPFLPKNPHIADWLLAKALQMKYKKDVPLSEIDDALEWQAHNAALSL